MTNIRNDLNIDEGPFSGLLNKPGEIHAVFEVFYATIMASFQVVDVSALGKHSAIISQEEIKRRFKICEHWFRVMRGDLGYSLQRTLAKIPQAMVCELTGQDFTPTKEEAQYGYASTMNALGRAVVTEED